MEKRFDQLEKRLDSLEQKLDRVEQRLDMVEQRLDRVEQRLDNLEMRVTRLENEVGELKDNVKELNRRMNAVYDQVAFLTEFRTEVLIFKDETNKKFEKVTKEQEAIKDWLKDQEVEIRTLKLAQNQ